jgi:hypothetical protein
MSFYLFPILFYFSALFYSTTALDALLKKTAKFTAHLFDLELSGHQCGRSLAFIKNMRSAKNRTHEVNDSSSPESMAMSNILSAKYEIKIDPIENTCWHGKKRIMVNLRQIERQRNPEPVGYYRYVFSDTQDS